MTDDRPVRDTAVRVELREVREEDLPLFFEYQLDPEACRMVALPAREREPCLRHWTRILADECVTKRTVLVNGQVAGDVVCFPQDGLPHVGYWIGREFWGRGVATAALCAFLEEVTARTLFPRVAAPNVASQRMLAKCGFVVSGEEVTDAGPPAELKELIMTLGAEATPGGQATG